MMHDMRVRVLAPSPSTAAAAAAAPATAQAAQQRPWRHGGSAPLTTYAFQREVRFVRQISENRRKPD